MKVCSIFLQVLNLFSRREFEEAVKEHKAEPHARDFTSWGKFLACRLVSWGPDPFVARFPQQTPIITTAASQHYPTPGAETCQEFWGERATFRGASRGTGYDA